MKIKINEILNNLHKEEEVEERFIEMYEFVLSSGAKYCITEEKRQEFIDAIFILKEDSERHRKAIIKLLKKYE